MPTMTYLSLNDRTAVLEPWQLGIIAGILIVGIIVVAVVIWKSRKW